MMEKDLCYGFGAFVGWTVTSFFCHFSAKLFLRTAISESSLDNGLWWAVVITFAQITMCYLLTDLHLFEARSRPAKIVLATKTVCHVFATLATNYSMTLVHASSTFAIKLLEPITSAIVQKFVFGTSLSPSALFSLPITISGAVVFCGSSIDTSVSLFGIMMAFMSNVILAFRNVAIKLEQGDVTMKKMQLRQRRRTLMVLMPLACLLVGIECLASQKLLASSITFMIVTATSSSFFHVAYSYISTNVVLSYMTVVSHSVANIFKRVLVVLLLYSVGQRQANLSNVFGLGVCIIGLLLYVRSKLDAERRDDKNSKGLLDGGFSRSIVISLLAGLITVGSLGVFVMTLKNPNVKNHLNVQLPPVSSLLQHLPISATKRIPQKQQPQLPPLTRNSSNGTVRFIAEMFPPLFIPDRPPSAKVVKDVTSAFLTRKLITAPQETDVLSPLLTTTLNVIKETQRVHMNLFTDLIGRFKYAVLFDVATYENKGDPAISVGQTYLIRRLGLKLLYYCNLYACNLGNLQKVKVMLAAYPIKDVVVLLQGGGNLVGYEVNDKLRAKIFEFFGQYRSVLFPQSILIRPTPKAARHLGYCKKLYKKQTNLTIVLRDRQSLWYAKQYFSGGPRLALAPDMAFQIGHVPRFISPMFDILWIRRNDEESPRFKMPSLPPNITVHVADWWLWKTPTGKTSMETAFLMTNNGLIFLQRGRVVITDRLHGHILSILLNIPHVLIDNPYRKLSMFRNSWTRSVENTVLVNSAEDAIKEAVKLLHKYEKQLPPIIPYMNINENPSKK